MTNEQIQKLADDHWEYVEQVIRNEYDSEIAEPIGTAMDIDAYCRRVELHYKTAFIHGFKHGYETAFGPYQGGGK